MYLFSSIRSREAEVETDNTDTTTTEAEARAEETQNTSEQASDTLYHAFSPPPLVPEDVAILVNLINGSIRRGTLTIEEVRVLLGSYDKLAACVHTQPEWFHFESEKVPLGEYGDDSATSVTAGQDVTPYDREDDDVREAKWVAAYRRNRKKVKARLRRAAKRRARRRRR